jgi:hypothetical protein
VRLNATVPARQRLSLGATVCLRCAVDISERPGPPQENAEQGTKKGQVDIATQTAAAIRSLGLTG